jgi:opacity protein-like surface antigen
MQMKTRSLSTVIVRTAAVAFFSAAANLCLIAQSPSAFQPVKPLDLKASLLAPLDLSRPADLNYSSSVGAEETASVTSFDLRGGTSQPPPRRRYGHTNYSDRWHNTDGSKKYTFSVGGGFDMPAGASGRDLTISWKFQAGASYNFNKKFGVQLEYNYDKFGDTLGNLTRQYNRYNALGLKDQNGRPVSFAGLDGTTHIWSITLNPHYTFYQGDAVGAYVIGGGGFYRKVSNFTLPQQGVYCDFYGFCYTFTQNQVFDHYSNNAGGFSGGLGLTYRFSRFGSESFYTEARYAWVNNQPSQNSVNGLYPENNHRTGYFPVPFGIRF